MLIRSAWHLVINRDPPRGGRRASDVGRYAKNIALRCKGRRRRRARVSSLSVHLRSYLYLSNRRWPKEEGRARAAAAAACLHLEASVFKLRSISSRRDDQPARDGKSNKQPAHPSNTGTPPNISTRPVRPAWRATPRNRNPCSSGSGSSKPRT